MPADEVEPLNRIGAVILEPSSTPPGVYAAWTLKAAFYWEQTFPPGEEVVVEHSYRPVVGFAFFGDYVFTDSDYPTKYCMDDAFIRAAKAKLAAIKDTPNPYLDEQRISLHPDHRPPTGPARSPPSAWWWTRARPTRWSVSAAPM